MTFLNGISLVACTVAAAYVIFLTYLWCVQRRLVFRVPPSTMPWGDLTVARPDGVLRGWVSNPDESAAVVVFGGNAMPVAGVGAEWSRSTPAAIFMLPYRGYEGQFGSPSETDLIADGVALVEQVQRTHSPVVLVGISLGSGVATQVAVETRPDGVVLVTPYDRLDRVAQDQWPLVPTRLVMRDHFDSVSAVKKLAGIPVSIFQADLDEVVLAPRTESLAKAIPGGPSSWVHVPTTHSGVWSSSKFGTFIGDQVRAAQNGMTQSKSVIQENIDPPVGVVFQEEIRDPPPSFVRA